jgi:hypothetical protein
MVTPSFVDVIGGFSESASLVEVILKRAAI